MTGPQNSPWTAFPPSQARAFSRWAPAAELSRSLRLKAEPDSLYSAFIKRVNRCFVRNCNAQGCRSSRSGKRGDGPTAASERHKELRARWRGAAPRSARSSPARKEIRSHPVHGLQHSPDLLEASLARTPGVIVGAFGGVWRALRPSRLGRGRVLAALVPVVGRLDLVAFGAGGSAGRGGCRRRVDVGLRDRAGQNRRLRLARRGVAGGCRRAC